MHVGQAEIAIVSQYLASPRVVNAATARCYQHGAAGLWQVATLVAGSKRQSLLMAGDDDKMFMTKSLNVTPKTTEHHLIVRSDKSVAYVTNNTQELSYRKQIARQMRTQCIVDINSNPVTLKSALSVTQGKLKTEPLDRSYTTYY